MYILSKYLANKKARFSEYISENLVFQNEINSVLTTVSAWKGLPGYTAA